MRKSNVHNITKVKRSVRAISPIIATLLLIAIVVVASLVAYFFVTGYIGKTTVNVGHELKIPNFTSIGQSHNLTIYVQNTGQGAEQLKQDSAVYVNDTLVPIVAADGKDVATGQLITVNEGQTVALLVQPPNYNQGDYVRIKVVTVGGTSMQTSGTGTPGNTGTSNSGLQQYAITVSAGAGGSINPAGPTVTVYAGATQVFAIAANTGYHIASVVVDGVSQGAVTSYSFTNIQANHVISATFASGVQQYTIGVSAGAGGSISPAGPSVLVNAGGSQGFTIAANSGNHIADVVVDGVSQGAVASYTFSNVQVNHAISATFASNSGVQQYTISVSAGAGGSITPAGQTVTVYAGTTQAFTIAADSGNHIVSVIVDGASQGAIGSYTFSNIQANHAISATFASGVQQYTIGVSAGAGGSITPTGPSVLVNAGGSQAFTIAANSGNHIVDVVVDGISQGAVASYTFSNVQANHAISTTFAPNSGVQQYTITVSTGAGGSITPAGPSVLVNAGANQPFTIVANSGYNIANVVVDGVSQGAITSYTFTNIQANHAISATFVVSTGVTYTISVSAGAGGTVTPAGPSVVVNQGSTQVFAIAANSGYNVADVQVDGVSQGAITSYTFTNVQAAHSISATFVVSTGVTYTISVSSGAGGSITPAGPSVVVNQGATQVFTVAANSGYNIADVQVDGVSQGAVGSYAFVNVQAAHSISATFVANTGVTYSISVSSGSGGSITPAGPSVIVNAGATQVFTIAASSGYNIADVQVDGVSQGAISSYTFTNVQANHAISASFVVNTGVTYTITVTQGANGVISPGTTTVNAGATQVFTIAASSGYHIVTVTVDGVSQGAVASYTFSNVQATHGISATFASNSGVQQFAITVSAGAGGSISPAGPTVTVYAGVNQPFSITANSGYNVADVQVDGVSQGAISSYTFVNVQAAHSISATFVVSTGVTYTISVSSGAGGSITPAGPSVVVNQGATQVFTIAANSGYNIGNVMVDGVSQGAVGSYAFVNVQAAHSISATFVLNTGVTYTISVSAGAGGSIAPAGPSVVVNQGATQMFAIAANTGYHVVDVAVDGVSQGAVASYTFSNVQATHGISATFASNSGVQQFAITVSAGAGGSISPAGPTVTVYAGVNQPFSITANSGYNVADVQVDGVSQGAITSYTFVNVQAAHSISATFVVSTGVQYEITVTQGANGVISPAGPSIMVNQGATQVFTIAANSGYNIADVQVDGVSQGAISSYAFVSVQANHRISASFVTSTGVTYTISVSSGAGGSITPAGPSVVVNQGATQVFTIAANSGYNIGNVMVDGVSQGAVGSYAFVNVQAAHSISATFVANTGVTYTITVTQGANGVISPAGPSVVVNQGATQVFAIAANSGYNIANVVVDGVSQGAITSYTFVNVQAVHAISASFVVNTGLQYTITVAQGANGLISPAGPTVTVNPGATQVFTIAANSGYNVANVVVDGVSQGAISSYTFTNVQANHAISATFAVNTGVTYTITVSAGAGGSISPAGPSVVVNQGATQVFTIAANSGYNIANVVVDGISQGAVGSYAFVNVQAAHSISATFVINTGVQFAISVSAGTGGTISPAGPSVVVNQGATQVFAIAANSGYNVANVVVDGVSQGAISSYTFANVQTNHVISAAFVTSTGGTYTITVTQGANGVISPAGPVIVNAGATQVFAIAGNSGYHIASVVIDGVSQGTPSSYTFTNVRANHAISATFAADTGKLVFTGAPSSMTVGQIIPIQVQRQTSAGVPTTTGGTITVGLGTSSKGGGFYNSQSIADNNLITSIQIGSGASTSATIYYVDYNTGTTTLTPTLSGLTSVTQTITVTGNSEPSYSPGISTNPSQVIAGSPATFTITITKTSALAFELDISYITLIVPQGFTGISINSVTPHVAYYNGNGGSWTGTLAGNVITLQSSGAYSDLEDGTNDYVTVVFTATPPAAGTYTFVLGVYGHLGAVDDGTHNMGPGTGTNPTVTVYAPGSLDHFTVTASGGGNIGTQAPGTPFSISITAKDQNGVTVNTYSSSVPLSVSGGLTISPISTGTSGWSNGVWTGSVTLTGTGSGITITANDGLGHQGASNPFTVSAAAPFGIDKSSTGYTNSNSATVTVTLTGCAANDVIIVVGSGNSGSNTVSSVSDNLGTHLSWAERASVDSSGHQRISEWYAVFSAGGSITITVTFSSGDSTNGLTAVAFAISGANTANPFDTHSGLPYTNTGSGTTPSITGVATTNAHDMIIGLQGSRAATTETAAGTGVSLINSITSTAGSAAAEDEVVTSAQSGATVSFGTSTNSWAMIVDAVRAAS